jgi:hypothetical protein
VIQIFEGLETNGVLVGEMVKTNRGLMWNVILPCKHKQLALHSDLATEHQPVCATCIKTVELKAHGVETDEQFRADRERKKLRMSRPRPIVVVEAPAEPEPETDATSIAVLRARAERLMGSHHFGGTLISIDSRTSRITMVSRCERGHNQVVTVYVAHKAVNMPSTEVIVCKACSNSKEEE